MQPYVHRQVSPLIAVVCGLVSVVLLVAGLWCGQVAIGVVAFVLFAGIGLAFSSLSTRVDSRGVSWAFTFGAPAGSVPVDAVADVQLTRTNFWEGWGIHWTIWHGWLWNVAGYGAVAIRKKAGGTVTLGTDDPQGLYGALRAAGLTATPQG
jgi:hypothetical protein